MGAGARQALFGYVGKPREPGSNGKSRNKRLHGKDKSGTSCRKREHKGTSLLTEADKGGHLQGEKYALGPEYEVSGAKNLRAVYQRKRLARKKEIAIRKDASNK